MKASKDAVFLEGDKIVLRTLMPSDIKERYLSWLNDPVICQYLEVGIFPTTMDELRKFYEQISVSKTDVFLAIVVKKNRKHIGNIKLGGINWVHGFANLGIVIGEKEYWAKGIGQEACRLMLEYAFHRLNLHKVTLGVWANHFPAIRAYKKIGFQEEGRLRRMFKTPSGYVDKLIMGILVEESLNGVLKGKKSRKT